MDESIDPSTRARRCSRLTQDDNFVGGCDAGLNGLLHPSDLIWPALHSADAILTSQEGGYYKHQSSHEFHRMPGLSFKADTHKGIEENGDCCK